jgi:5-methylcytosine-specific restriction endonuclease McrA
MKKRSTESRACVQCGAVFFMATYWQLTCSAKCGSKHQNSKKPRFLNDGSCRRCGTSLKGRRTNVIYCSRTCKSMDFAFHHRYKSRLVNKTRRMEIIERDNWACYLCSQILAFKEIELDHLIPHSRNGSSDADNLAVSCLPCNRSRGNRIGVRQLQKLFELRAEI